MSAKAISSKRAVLKRKLTTFETYVQNFKEQIKCNATIAPEKFKELERKVEGMNSALGDFEMVTEAYITEDLEGTEEAYGHLEDYEARFTAIWGVATNILEMQVVSPSRCPSEAESLGTTGAASESLVRVPKLPELKLKVFDGTLSEWNLFKEVFVEAIHNNNELSNIVKFQYLTSVLTGSASNVIRNLSTTGENYDVAWQALCTRFDNKRLTAFHHLRNLSSLEHCNKENSNHLRKLLDNCRICVRSLDKLVSPDQQRDLCFIHLIWGILDSRTARDFETSTSEFPTLEEFFEFLEKRSSVLESIEHRTSRISIDRQHSRRLTGNISVSCACCGAESHNLNNCTKFKSLSAQERLSKVKSWKLCLNCFSSNHFIAKCPSKSYCRVCKRSHHTLLHFLENRNRGDSAQSDSHRQSGFKGAGSNYNRVRDSRDNPVSDVSKINLISASGASGDLKSSQVPSWATPGSISSFSPSNLASQNQNLLIHNTRSASFVSSQNQGQILMPTAIVQASGPPKRRILAKALLDSGSTVNIVTADLCEKFKLKTSRLNQNILGLGNKRSHVSTVCDLYIQAHSGSFKQKISCLVLPEIRSEIPSFTFDASCLTLPANIILADPQFDVPSKIDILLGSGIFWSLLLEKQVSVGAS